MMMIGKLWRIYGRSELNREKMFIFERVMTFSCLHIYEAETETYTYGIAFQRLSCLKHHTRRVSVCPFVRRQSLDIARKIFILMLS